MSVSCIGTLKLNSSLGKFLALYSTFSSWILYKTKGVFWYKQYTLSLLYKLLDIPLSFIFWYLFELSHGHNIDEFTYSLYSLKETMFNLSSEVPLMNIVLLLLLKEGNLIVEEINDISGFSFS